MLTPRK